MKIIACLGFVVDDKENVTTNNFNMFFLFSIFVQMIYFSSLVFARFVLTQNEGRNI